MSDGIGYLTPDYDGNASLECSRLTLPSYLWRFVSGALGELTEVTNWVQLGDLTPDDMVSIFTDALDEMRECYMIGAVIPFVRSALPANVLPCDGSTHQKADYPMLYDVLPAYLLIDADTFNTPDLTAMILLGEGNGRTLGDTGGEEAHTLTEAEIPPHTHGYTGALPSLTTIVFPDEPSAVPSVETTAPTGGGQAHNNMPPYYVVIYGIVAK